MPSEHHNLDIHPIPKEKVPMFINEPWLIDESIYVETVEQKCEVAGPEEEDDNIRVYIPLDISRNAILRRLENLISKYSEANEENELNFSADVDRLISQIEIYDQIWYVRHMPVDNNQHSKEAKTIVKKFVAELESISDGCAEFFLFDTVEELREEYLCC